MQASEAVQKIRELDAQIAARFAEHVSDHEMGRVDEHNADDRESIHEHAMALVVLLERALPVIAEALGDAVAYRTDSGEADEDFLEDYEKESLKKYRALAEVLGLELD